MEESEMKEVVARPKLRKVKIYPRNRPWRPIGL
jgi:hypothetical protein